MRTTAILAVMGLSLAAAVMVVGAAPTEPRPADVPEEQVAREIVKIQEQLGGSIVAGSALDRLAPPPPPRPPLPPSPVTALREAAWQLDNSAHQLEAVDLYDQADSLRRLADEFRQEARKRKRRAEKPE